MEFLRFLAALGGSSFLYSAGFCVDQGLGGQAAAFLILAGLWIMWAIFGEQS